MATESATPYNNSLKALFSVLLLVALGCNWWPLVDELAQAYLSDTIASNAIVFGVVRTLNGIISVVQSAEIGIGVAGVTIGEIFDPVNDLIERFSSLLLVTLTALGIQQVLLIFTASLVLKIVFTCAALVAAIWLWWPMQRPSWALRIFMVLVLLRFLLTLQVGIVWLFDWLYFDATGEQALSVLQATTQVLESIKQTLTTIDLGELIFGNNSPKLESEDIGARISSSVVTLIVGMLFKSILIPVGSLWLGYKAVKPLIKGSL